MNKICEQAPLYFYGELDHAAAESFRKHLCECNACRQELAFLQQTQAALMPPAAPPAIVERVLCKTVPAPWWRRIYKPVLAAGLIGIIAVWSFVAQPVRPSPAEDATDWVAYISAEADEEYNHFVADFEAFEEDF